MGPLAFADFRRHVPVNAGVGGEVNVQRQGAQRWTVLVSPPLSVPGGSLGWCGAGTNLTIRLAPQLAEFATENQEWLRICRLPAYAPELNPAEGIWSLLQRSIASFAAADVASLVRIVKRKLKKIRYRPHLIDGCLAGSGLTLEAW